MSEPVSTTSADPSLPIDVVVPIYNAAADVRRCVASVLACTRTPYRLVLIDDASPDPAVGEFLAELSGRALRHVVVLRNETNLGFTRTANRGMQLSKADVVLLNSDTVVSTGWLEALVRCAASNPSFGTITPFSNNAEICSFPRFCVDNGWGDENPDAVAARLARTAVPTYPDLPTAVGFCMYVRRTLIEAIGVFDDAFGRGYGEENDFSLRGFAVGYRNVLCDDAFVVHVGGRSFMGEKAQLGPRNLEILLARHPHYVAMVQDYIARDPLKPLREAALSAALAVEGATLGVLHVLHHHGGGAELHVRALVEACRRDARHYVAITLGERWLVEEHHDDGTVRTFDLSREENESWAGFLGAVCATFHVGLVHVHHISGCREGLLEALDGLEVPYALTVHDLYLACPTITMLGGDGRYCGGQTDVRVCATCLAGRSAWADVDIASWRARHTRLVQRAAFVVAPSAWAAAQWRRYFPDRSIETIPHGLPAAAAERTAVRAPIAVLLPDDGVPTVAVLGAIGPDKGARRLERLVEVARARGARVRFVLVGYLDREPGPWQSDDALITVNGRYDRRDLPQLLAHYRAELAIFPSSGPETFCYTLSEAWRGGVPAFVPPIGALAERVTASGAGWTWTDAQWRDDDLMLDSILEKLAPPAAAERGRAATAARAASAADAVALADMSRRTAALYRNHAAETAAQRLAPLAAARLRDALGYVLWYPPIPIATEDRRHDDGDKAPVRGELAGSWTARARAWIGRRWRVVARALPPGNTPVRS